MVNSLLLAVAFAPFSPEQASRAFGHWVSVCDNGRRCEVSSDIGRIDNPDVRMHLNREAARAARVNVTIETPGSDGRYALRIDKRSFPLVWRDSELTVPSGVDLPAARALAAAKSIAVVGGGNTYLLPADGVGEALLDMDRRQRRTGTDTALVAMGPKPASAVPPVPLLPVRPERKRPVRGLVIRPSDATVAEWRRAAGCDPDAPDTMPLKSWPIDRRTAVIVVSCHAGGHNSDRLVKVGHQADGKDAQPAEFDFNFSLSEESGPTTAPENPDRDPATGRLVSGANGGLVYESSSEEWVWDGTRFRLVAQSTSYGSTFRARVRTR